MPENERTQDTRLVKNFAYKAVFVADGIIFLFEEIKAFTTEDVRINLFNGELFLELGNNVTLITERILGYLIKTKRLFLYKGAFSAYEAEEQALAFETKPEVLARIQGAWEIARTTDAGKEKPYDHGVASGSSL